jgi:hypothetical protein
VFGVSRPAANPLVAAREGEAQFQQDLGECRLQGITFDVSVAEPDLKAAGGQALGSHGAAPLFVVKKSGKGAAVLLNCFMDSFNQRRKLRIEGPLRRVVSGALAVGGVRPPVAVQVQSTPAVLPLVTTYASGGALYVGAQFDPGDRDETWTADAAFGFPRAGYVYDMREGKALGRTDKAAKAMLNGDAAFFAVLPYRVEAVRVAAGQVRQGAMATCQAEVRVSEAAAGLHVLRVEVLGPDGVPRPHYGAVALADGGKATHAIPLALNDPKGRWTVRFTDVVSRASGEAVLEVQ